MTTEPGRLLHVRIVKLGEVEVEVRLHTHSSGRGGTLELQSRRNPRLRAVLDIPSSQGANQLIDAAIRAFLSSLQLREG